MSDTPVIYENPRNPLPEWVRGMLCTRKGLRLAIGAPERARIAPESTTGWASYGESLVAPVCQEYSLSANWRDSLRRLVRLSDPAYYVPENPHTDSEGFLPHDGEQMPEWVRGKRVMVRLRQSGTTIRMTEWSNRLRWLRSGKAAYGDIIAYRIVGEQRSENMKDRNENIGLERRYEVRKLTNPGKALDCIVLEFDDPLARKGIEAWANALCAEYPAKDYGQVAADVYNKLASYGHYNDASASDNGDDPEQFASGDPVPLVDKPRSPSDASDEQYRRNPHLPSQEEVEERMYQQEQRYHRNELAARTLAPVPGMDEWMHDVIREARRLEYRKSALQGLLAQDDVGGQVTATTAFEYADAMIEKEGSE